MNKKDVTNIVMHAKFLVRVWYDMAKKTPPGSFSELLQNARDAVASLEHHNLVDAVHIDRFKIGAMEYRYNGDGNWSECTHMK